MTSNTGTIKIIIEICFYMASSFEIFLYFSQGGQQTITQDDDYVA
jgi:hypothetical protein